MHTSRSRRSETTFLTMFRLLRNANRMNDESDRGYEEEKNRPYPSRTETSIIVYVSVKQRTPNALFE